MSAPIPVKKAKTAPVCQTTHPVEIDSIESLDREKAQKMAEFFGMLGDPNRLRIISILALQELCVCDIAATLEMSESAVSHQMRILRTMRLVKYRKQGRKVYYHLLDRHVLDLYSSVAEHLDEPENED